MQYVLMVAALVKQYKGINVLSSRSVGMDEDRGAYSKPDVGQLTKWA